MLASVAPVENALSTPPATVAPTAKVHRRRATHRASVLDGINTAVKEKEFKKLRKLLAQKRQLSGHMLNMADESGTLLHLLSSMDLPLDRYPAVAQSAQQEILALIDSTATLSKKRHSQTVHGIGDSIELDLMKVLWNIIPVPAPVAETVLDHLVEEMLITRTPHAAGGRSVAAVPSTMDLPDNLGAIYLMRMIKEPDKEQITFENFTDLQLPGCPHKLHLTALSKVTVGNHLDDLGRRATRRAALIPEDAVHFAHIIGGIGFPSGGFLYLDKSYRPLAVNAISYEPTPYAICFRKSEELALDAMEKLHSHASQITCPRLREKGVVKYVWIGQQERDMCDASGYGFAYFFEDSRMDRFFPIQSIGEVLDRGRIVGHLNAALLDSEGTGIEYAVAHADHHDTKPVKFARLKVPGLIHPAILHALLLASRSEVVRTRAAKAITTSAFGKAKPWILFGLLLDLASLACTVWFTARARAGSTHQRDIDYWFLWSFMLGEWIKTLSCEVVLWCSYWYHGFGRRNFSSQNMLDWSYLLLMLALLEQLLSPTTWERTLLAVVGCIKWMRMLHSLRGFDMFQLGMRTLPILAALGEMASFLLVMLFFLSAWVHVKYALSDVPITDIAFSSYQMAFLGDILQESENAEEFSGASFQGVAFVACSLVVMVAMTNIFIGIMGSAFEEKRKIVEDLFVKARAEISLDFILVSRLFPKVFCLPRPRPQCIWLCFHTDDHDRQEQQQGHQHEERHQQQQHQHHHEAHAGHVQDKLVQLAEDLQAIKERLGQQQPQQQFVEDLGGIKKEICWQQRQFAATLRDVQGEFCQHHQQLARKLEDVQDELGHLARVMASSAAPDERHLPQTRWELPAKSDVLS